MQKEEPIAAIVRKKLAAKPGLRGFLQQGIVNATALSRQLADELGTEHLQAIVSAVKRFRNEIESEQASYERTMRRLVADCTVMMSSDIAVITLPHPIDWHALEKHLQIKHVIEGVGITNIIVDEQAADEFTKLGLNPIEVRKGLVTLTIRSNLDYTKTPGALIYLLSPISYSGINIEETLTCYNEKILVMTREDGKKAFDVITKEIERARERIGNGQ